MSWAAVAIGGGALIGGVMGNEKRKNAQKQDAENRKLAALKNKHYVFTGEMSDYQPQHIGNEDIWGGMLSGASMGATGASGFK